MCAEVTGLSLNITLLITMNDGQTQFYNSADFNASSILEPSITKLDSCMSGTFPPYVPLPICATPYMRHALYAPHPIYAAHPICATHMQDPSA